MRNVWLTHVLPNVRFHAVRDEAELRRAAGGSGEESLRASRVTLADGTTLAAVSDIDDARRLANASPAEVESYLLAHMEDNLPLFVGGTARIDEKSAHHFAWAPVNMTSEPRRFKKARGRAATAIADILASATADATTQEANLHNSSARIWRIRVPFAVPALSPDGRQVTGITVYDGDVIIKDEGHGKFFYDLSNLKENVALTSAARGQLALFMPHSRSAATSDASLSAQQGGSQSQSVPGVNGNLRESRTGSLFDEIIFDLEDTDDGLPSIESVLTEFEADKEEGRSTMYWRTIPADQYKAALHRFMREGELFRFPERTLRDWFEIVVYSFHTLECARCG